jgi:hypothetical protein
MPSRELPALLASAVAACSLAGIVAAQPEVGSELDLAARTVSRVVVVLVINFVLGGVMFLLAPAYARRMVAEIRADAGTAFLWGLLVGIGVPIALVLIAITIIGLLVTIPGLIALFFLALIGKGITICWIGDLLTGRDDLDVTAVGVGAAALAVVGAVPLVGDLATTLLGLVGLEVVGRDLYTSWGL